MNDRQRDLFLWLWSRRRKPGQAAIALRGALIGALGGVVFALILGGSSSVDRGSFTGLSVIIPIIERGGMLLVLSVGAFGLIGFILANRVFAAQEEMYHSMLQAGARVPEQKPIMRPGDRGPAVAVAIVGVLIVAFIAALFVMYW